MTEPDTISADYSLRPSELASTLALLVEARQPVVVWGAPGCAKSQIAQQVAAQAGREYVDVRALLLDPVDLRGIPWRDGADRTRWAPPAFLPPSDADGSWLINLEELPSALPMVQAALYQLVLDRKCGEYELPEGAALIACGNREGDRGVVHRMPAPLASRFVHLEIRVDAADWCAWGAANGIAPEVLFFVSMRPELLHAFNPQSTEKAFPCPRTWEMVSNIVHRRNGLDPVAERALYRGTVGEAAAVEFSAFLQVWHELPHPRTVIDDPEGAVIPGNASAFDRAVRLALQDGRRHQSRRHRHLRHKAPARGRRVPRWLLHPPRAFAPAHPGLHPVGRRQNPLTPHQETHAMNLTHDAMLVSLRINSWSGRLYDRQASQQVAVHNDADSSAGRYNKRLLPKQAFAALAATMSNARTSHNANTLPWDDQGGRLLTVANYDRYTAALDTLVERVVRERARFIEDYDDYVDQARLDLGRLFRLEDYPDTEALQGKFAIRYRIVPVPDARHFMADLAEGETERVKRDIESQVRTRLNDAQRDLYRRLGEAVERVGERLREDENGKPLVFRDSLIENIRELVDVVPRLNIFADDDLAMLCREVKDKFAGIEPNALRPSGRFDPNLRRQVKRDADALTAQFAGYFAPAAENREAA